MYKNNLNINKKVNNAVRKAIRSAFITGLIGEDTFRTIMIPENTNKEVAV